MTLMLPHCTIKTPNITLLALLNPSITPIKISNISSHLSHNPIGAAATSALRRLHQQQNHHQPLHRPWIVDDAALRAAGKQRVSVHVASGRDPGR